MKWETVLADVDRIASSDVPDGFCRGISYDSRQVGQGHAFVAISGFQQDGHQYILQALAAGASLIVISDEAYRSSDYAWVQVADARLALAQLSCNYYEHPSKALTLIGVTGTNGKTTTTNLICQLLEAEGATTALIGTIANRVGTTVLPASRTTPEPPELQQILRQALEAGISHVVMEVSSHALALHRVTGCDFDVAVMTNLTQDHLDFHTDMADYAQAKAQLFRMLDEPSVKNRPKAAIVNLDDPWAGVFLTASHAPLITYSLTKPASWQVTDVVIGAGGSQITLDGQVLQLPLVGAFNVYNAVAALAAVAALGFDEARLFAHLGQLQGVEGRFQVVPHDEDFLVIVDYAHTPDGLEKVISTAKAVATGQVITVFGCGGNRDRTKRPLMGEVAAKLSDRLVVTSDNPRLEEPQRIIEDILPGFTPYCSAEHYHIEVDRRAAIFFAIAMALPGDVVLIAGKGHEAYQDVQGVKHHFNDYEVAQEALGQRQ